MIATKNQAKRLNDLNSFEVTLSAYPVKQMATKKKNPPWFSGQFDSICVIQM